MDDEIPVVLKGRAQDDDDKNVSSKCFPCAFFLHVDWLAEFLLPMVTTTASAAAAAGDIISLPVCQQNL